MPPHANNKLAQTSASWLSDSSCQRQGMPPPAPSLGEPRSMRRMGGSGRLGLIGPVLDTGATCDAATSSTWCGGATWSTSSSEPSAYTLRTRYALAATPLPARGRDVVEMGPGAESCRLPQSRTPWRSVTNARMPSAASSSAGSSGAHTTTKISNFFLRIPGGRGWLGSAPSILFSDLRSRRSCRRSVVLVSPCWRSSHLPLARTRFSAPAAAATP